MDKFLYLQACPMCILTRYVFGLIALSAIIGILLKKPIIGQLLIMISSLIGLLVTTRQIYIQNMINAFSYQLDVDTTGASYFYLQLFSNSIDKSYEHIKKYIFHQP